MRRIVSRYQDSEAENSERTARLIRLLAAGMERLATGAQNADEETVDFSGDLPVTTTDAQPGDQRRGSGDDREPNEGP